MALHHRFFYLKLDHSNCLVHLSCQARIYCIINIFIQDLWHKADTWIILVNFCRKHGQWTQIDTVSIFQHIKAVVADGYTKHITDTGQIAGSCSHPGNIMISPLDVHIMEVH